ncbi:hypothetical protein GJ744_002619 [Endocarpon pusillum]|uniref:Peptidase S33 tripeptidyl aminopeptidase-like C-terminal domain-containing protein n=1 Tax=Endocarpon pusillum TaxID=364733 RepID=A0A8H7A7M3_9EURO|nr:hypothetical protein GJ744_002619 [Endocarpon pusillum]
MEFLVALLALSFLSTTEALPLGEGNVSQNRTINWHPCPDVEAEVFEALGVPIPLPFDCASLPVPLDYTDPESGTLDLALIRLNATQEPVLGSVLWNPGGPGGTGVENLAVQSEELIEVLGGQYNVVSWDPRGTGKTIPFDCGLAETAAVQRRDADSLLRTNLTERFLNGGWDDAESYAEACYSTMNATGELIGTAFVARDMVEIIDALGEDGLLRYWGLSYGTQLGSTFAAMFPERVERMLLDANTNPHDYVVGHWGNYLVDADKTLLAFLEECAKAKDRCALAQYTGLTTAADLLEMLNAGLEPLLQNATSGHEEGWLAYLLVKQYLYNRLYWPRLWPRLAETITGFLNGSLTDLALPTQAPTREPYNLGVDSINGIRCSDALWRASSPEEILDQVEYQATVSESFSDVGYDFTWSCAAWKMEAKEQYTGNFSVKTKFPILLVNGAFDVAIPLVSAFNASAGFEDSVVLIHGGYGHGLTAHPSLCTARAVQAYFKDGVLPEPGTTCEPDVEVWDLPEYSTE